MRIGELLGLHFTRPHAVLLIAAEDFLLRPGKLGLDASSARRQQRSETLLNSVRSFFVAAPNLVCGYIGAGEVAALIDSNTAADGAEAGPGEGRPPGPASWAELAPLQRLARSLLRRLSVQTQGSITMGLGRFQREYAGLPPAYREARVALRIGRRLHGANDVYALTSLGAAAFAGPADEPTKRELARQILQPLEAKPGLRETLDAFFTENGDQAAAATRLEVHRNTLRYRFDTIAGLTGLDPRRFDDAVQLRLALLLQRLGDEAA